MKEVRNQLEKWHRLGGPKTARRGQWVQIHQVVLPPEGRSPHVPPETQKVPLELVAKGFLVDAQAEVGKTANIRTLAGRELTGTLVAVEPAYGHDFGRSVPELLAIGPEVRALITRRHAATEAGGPDGVGGAGERGGWR